MLFRSYVMFNIPSLPKGRAQSKSVPSAPILPYVDFNDGTINSASHRNNPFPQCQVWADRARDNSPVCCTPAHSFLIAFHPHIGNPQVAYLPSLVTPHRRVNQRVRATSHNLIIHDVSLSAPSSIPRCIYVIPQPLSVHVGKMDVLASLIPCHIPATSLAENNRL